jgi:hypothetical protein
MTFYAGVGSWRQNKSALFPCGVLTPTTNDFPRVNSMDRVQSLGLWSIPFQVHSPHGHSRLHRQMAFVSRWPLDALPHFPIDDGPDGSDVLTGWATSEPVSKMFTHSR